MAKKRNITSSKQYFVYLFGLILLIANLKQPFSSKAFRIFLLHWIVCSNQPFFEVETPNFRQIFRFLKPDIVMPSADTIKKDIMKTFDEERIHLKETMQVYQKTYYIFHMKAQYLEFLFKNVSGRISFTLDAWTSRNMISFLGITCHWIDDDWALHETLVDFVKLSGAHSGDNLCEAFERSCRELAIFTKVCLNWRVFIIQIH